MPLENLIRMYLQSTVSVVQNPEPEPTIVQCEGYFKPGPFFHAARVLT